MSGIIDFLRGKLRQPAAIQPRDQFVGNPEGDPGVAANLLPRAVYQMCIHGGLIVGSFAKYMIGENVRPNDIDILVPLESWQTIALLIPDTAAPNRFGGWRFEVEGIEIDVWPDTLQNYLSQCRTKYGRVVCAVDFIHNRVFSAQQRELRL